MADHAYSYTLVFDQLGGGEDPSSYDILQDLEGIASQLEAAHCQAIQHHDGSIFSCQHPYYPGRFTPYLEGFFDHEQSLGPSEVFYGTYPQYLQQKEAQAKDPRNLAFDRALRKLNDGLVGKRYTKLSDAPTELLVDTLVGMTMALATVEVQPDRGQLLLRADTLRNQLNGLGAHFLHAFKAYDRLEQQLGTRAPHETYQGERGQFNLMVQYAIGCFADGYVLQDPDTGDIFTGEEVDSLRWELINYLDGEMDHGVYLRDTLLDAKLRELGLTKLEATSMEPDAKRTLYDSLDTAWVEYYDSALAEYSRVLNLQEEG